jgi:hypothetical protein
MISEIHLLLGRVSTQYGWIGGLFLLFHCLMRKNILRVRYHHSQSCLRGFICRGHRSQWTKTMISDPDMFLNTSYRRLSCNSFYHEAFYALVFEQLDMDNRKLTRQLLSRHHGIVFTSRTVVRSTSSTYYLLLHICSSSVIHQIHLRLGVPSSSPTTPSVKGQHGVLQRALHSSPPPD